MTTYETVGHAVNDPNSNLARWLRANDEKKAHNARVIDSLVARGHTREEAWSIALASARR